MSPRTLKQYEEIREERREQIMHVALELIASEGFSNVTIAKIAKRANISKGLMYNYFESKERLIFDITKKGIDEFLRIIDPDKDGFLTKQEFHLFIDQTFEIIQSNFKFWRLYFMIMFQPGVLKVVEPELNKVMEPFMNMAIDYFKRQGSEDPGADLRFFGAVMDGISLNYVMDNTNFPLEVVKKRLHEMYR